jgi:hypothetical protein
MKGTTSTQNAKRVTNSVKLFSCGSLLGTESMLRVGKALSTTDGNIISESAKAAAVKKGAGVMIGDHFVGLSISGEYSFSFPDIVY